MPLYGSESSEQVLVGEIDLRSGNRETLWLAIDVYCTDCKFYFIGLTNEG